MCPAVREEIGSPTAGRRNPAIGVNALRKSYGLQDLSPPYGRDFSPLHLVITLPDLVQCVHSRKISGMIRWTQRI